MKLSEEQYNEIIHFTQELVHYPGYSGDEENTANVVAKKMGALGYDDTIRDEWGNVIGIINGDNPGPTLLLDGHMDVVPIRMPELWKYPPYGAQIDDGKMWGIGTADMKGGLAAMVCSAGFVDRKRIHGQVIVSASVGEELLVGRALGKILDKNKVDAVIIGEPTDLKIAVAGVGRTTVEVVAHGKVSHSSRPDLGDNAIYRGIEVIEKIRSMRRKQHPLLGKEVIELVEVKSKPSPGNGSVPDYFWGLWECRIHPGENIDTLTSRFLDCIKDVTLIKKLDIHQGVVGINCYTGARLENIDYLPAWIIDREGPFLNFVKAIIKMSGLYPEHCIFPACCNINVSYGERKIPSILFGPGSLEHIHQPNEYIEISDLLQSATVYSNLIENYGKKFKN